MSQVIYRKYRSKNFKEIMGQSHIVSILKESVLSSNVSHGYLFCGPRGTGKTSLARLLAKAVNCENFTKVGDVCNECEYCKMINEGLSMDIIEMDAASNRGIEEIRNMRDTVNYMPTSLKKKAYIIDEAHMLTKEAFNALLKTLEEPPEHVLFILATTEAHKIPITILSRVQRFDLALASQEELTDKIKYIISQEGYQADNKALEIIYRNSGGSFRDAESILGKVLSSIQKKEISSIDLVEILGIVESENIEKFINALLMQDLRLSLGILTEIYDKSGSVNTIVDQSIERIRVLMINTVGNVSRDLYNLANLFINFKINSKEFNDKISLLQIELINYCNAEKNIGLNKVNQITSQKLGIKESSVEANSDNFNQTEINIESVDELINHIKLDSKSAYPRLKSILESSKIDVRDSILLITNTHKFNIIYLQRKEVKEYLLSKSKLLNIQTVNFVEDKDLNINVDNVEDKQPKVAVVAEEIDARNKTLPKQTDDTFVSDKDSKKKKPAVDNSDLVESLL